MKLLKKLRLRQGRTASFQAKFAYAKRVNCYHLQKTLLGTGGRTKEGRKSISSRGHIAVAFRRWTRHTSTHPALRALGVITSLRKESRQRKILALVKSVVGFSFYTPVYAPVVVGDFFRLCSHSKLNYRLISPLKEWPRALSFFPPYSVIVSINDKIAKAYGAVALLLSSNIGGGRALLRYPSGQLKFVSAANIATMNQPLRWTQTDARLRKAGWWVNKGQAPHVRGTVKNASDHPNGGRTRALKCPLTPWGTIAKKPRQPKKHKGLKALSKRLSNKQKFRALLEREEKEGRDVLRSLRGLLPKPPTLTLPSYE